MRLLLIVTSATKYASGKPTGLWLSEITHIYHAAEQQGIECVIASPEGGNIKIDPESLKPMMMDKMSKECWEQPSFKTQLEHTKSLSDVAREEFDCVYLAGGHGTMYDFPDNAILQDIVSKHFDGGKKVAAICHGPSGLLNVRLKSGDYLVAGRKLTGFDWFEETLAMRKNEVPFSLESELKKRGAKYDKALVPMTSKVVVDGNLITGQNPFSSKKMAEVVLRELK